MVISCKKAVHKVDGNYIGAWRGYDNKVICFYRLIIDDNSRGTWSNTAGSSECSEPHEEGKVKINKEETELKLGFFTFDIIIKPTKIDTPNPFLFEPNAKWYMTLRCNKWCRSHDINYFR